MKHTVKRFQKLLFFSALFNIVLALPLVIPVMHEKYLSLVWKLNQVLMLGGKEIIPPKDGIASLFINTAGIDLVLIGVIVFYAGLNPLKRKFIPLANAVGRTFFAMIIIYYVITMKIARIVLIIGGIDVIISIGFVYFLIRLRNLNDTTAIDRRVNDDVRAEEFDKLMESLDNIQPGRTFKRDEVNDR